MEVSPEYEGEWYVAPKIGIDGISFESYFIIVGKYRNYGQLCELISLVNNYSRIYSGDVKFDWNKSQFYIGKIFKESGRVNLDIDILPLLISIHMMIGNVL